MSAVVEARGREELLGKNRSIFLLVMCCQVGCAVFYNSTLAAFWEMWAFSEVQQGF